MVSLSKGLRQRDAADYAGINRSTYIHYEEAGRDFYPKEHMEKLAELFEVPLENLLDDYKAALWWLLPVVWGNAFRGFNADISEAHHIAYFSDSQNNDSSNIIILCPNHHRLIHKLNPKFDYNRGCFVFSENSELRIELDFHLMK